MKDSNTPITNAPNTWQPTEADKPPKHDAPITHEQFRDVLQAQVAKWRARKANASYDNEMDARTAFTLLCDQAKLMADLYERIA